MNAKRTIHHGDGISWLESTSLTDEHALVTSLPDASELPELGLAGWRNWFIDTAELACRRVADRAVAIFFQTDIKQNGRWIDKGYLASVGAERAASHLLWHKVACRTAPGTTTFGRPAYAHVLCFSRQLQLEPGRSSPDVLPQLGAMPWARAMGADVCAAIADFVVNHTDCRTVVDPFCGHGTMLAVANSRGLNAIGVERSHKRVRRARALTLTGDALDG